MDSTTLYRVRRFARNAILTRSLGRVEVRKRYFQRYLRGDFGTEVRTAYGFKMYLDPSDISISAVISATGLWEPRVSTLVAKLVKPSSLVVDAGANIGWFSLLAASRGARSVRAFEPEPTAANLLTRSARTNGFNNIKVEQTALLDRTGSAKLYISDTSNKGLHSIARQVGNSSIDVPCTTLDSSLSEPIDLLKLDTEGSEMRVVGGG